MGTIVVLYIVLSIIALIVILLHFSVTLSVKFDENGFSVVLKYLGFTLYPREKKSGSNQKNKTKHKKKSKIKSKKKKVKPKIKESFDKNDESFEKEISDYELMHGISKEHEDKLISDCQEEKKDADITKKSGIEEGRSSVSVGDKKNKSVKKIGKQENKKGKSGGKKGGGFKKKITDLKAKYNKCKPYIPMTWKYFKKLLKAVRISADDVYFEIGREDAHEAAIYYGALQAIIANTLSTLSEIFTVGVKKCDTECVFTKNTFYGRGKLSVRARPSVVIAILVCFAVSFLIKYLKARKKETGVQCNKKHKRR